jgi:hypothetical protein
MIFTKVKSLRKSSSEQGEKLQGLAVMGELDDKMANSCLICSYSAGDFGKYKSFNSSKISYVRNSKLFRHSSTRKYNGCGSSNIYTSISPSIDTTASQAPIAPEDPKPPVRPMVDENSAAGKAGVNAKEDWFLTRVTAPDISTKNLLMSMVLTDLANLNQKKITGKTLKYKTVFK